jgi:hypothetical protein
LEIRRGASSVIGVRFCRTSFQEFIAGALHFKPHGRHSANHLAQCSWLQS